LPSVLTVTNLLDSGPGSLRAEIAAANSGDTIDFAPRLHGTITLSSGELTISDSITINGPGADKVSVSGNDASRIFDITGSASVDIWGLTLTDGLATSGGGILLEDSAALNLSSCAVTENEAVGNAAGTGFGGGIEDTSSGTLTVTNCSFVANQAVATGPNTVPGTPGYTPGYIIALGGGIDLSFVASGSATISDSTFTGNQALGGVAGASAGGGALSNSSNTPGTTMTVTGCTISGNAAIGEAGGDGITNFGSGQGGGINDFDNLTVLDSRVAGNVAQGTPLAPGAVPSQTPSSGSATAGGGVFCLGVYVPAANVNISNSTLAGNQAVGGAGAAGVSSIAGGAGSAGSVGQGGGISLIVVPSAVVEGCALRDNVAQGGAGGNGAAGAQGGVGAPGASGGIDMAFGSVVTVSNTILSHNEAIGGAGGNGSKGGDGVGGGINDGTGVLYGASDDCTLTLTNCTLVHNQALGGAGGSGNNGGDALGGGLSVLGASTASIGSSALFANQAQGGPGGAGANGGSGLGGGLYNDAPATLSLTVSAVTGNQADGGAAGSGGSVGQGIGGGVYTLGTFTYDVLTVIEMNYASTSNNNIFG